MHICPFCKSPLRNEHLYLTHLWTHHAIHPQNAPIRKTRRKLADIIAGMEQRITEFLIMPPPAPRAITHQVDCLCAVCVDRRFDTILSHMDEVIAG